MNTKKECIAMLLAGGQGSRLGVLTQHIAKPAVPFGGKYRIIDFPLSNCVNSGIDTVGVLTQYQPLELNTYIGNGQPWDLDRMSGGVAILPPYMTSTRGDWYKGTANAVFQNINFIEPYDPEYVLVLSGDHIYKMNYDWMLRDHIRAGADCTIAVINVPEAEAPRFGIMNTDDAGRVLEFEEKPPHPKSTKASMGVYIFSWKVLRRYLTEDDRDPESHNDFGHDIIPKMLADGRMLYAYEYKGYWKDVGTIESLWEANMDILRRESGLVLHDPLWRIYGRNPAMPPQYVAPGAQMKNSMIAEGCHIEGTVENSIIFYDVKIEAGAQVRDSIVMQGSIVRAGATVDRAILADRVDVGAGAKIGAPGDGSITVLGSGAAVAERESVPAGTMRAAEEGGDRA